MKVFLPERRITSLALTWMSNPKEPFDNSNFTSLSQSLKEVKFLSWGGLYGRPSLDLICLHLQSLEVLEVVGVHDLTVRLRSCLASVLFLLTKEFRSFYFFPSFRAWRYLFFPKCGKVGEVRWIWWDRGSIFPNCFRSASASSISSYTSNLKHIRDGFMMGRGSGLCLPTMLARPFYPVGILDNESRGVELV